MAQQGLKDPDEAGAAARELNEDHRILAEWGRATRPAYYEETMPHPPPEAESDVQLL